MIRTAALFATLLLAAPALAQTAPAIPSKVMTPRPGRVAGLVRVPLPRPRVLSMLESGAMASVSAEIRRLLVDTTDDLVATAEAGVYAPVPGLPDTRVGARVVPGDAPPDRGSPAWFDPFGEDR